MKNLSKKVYRKDNETEDTSFSKGAYFKLTNKNNTMEVKMKPDLFQSILFVALQRKIDMNEIYEVPLTPVRLCLADIDAHQFTTERAKNTN